MSMRLTPTVFIAILSATGRAGAQPTIFEGGATSEVAWRAAAGGNAPMEMFEGYLGTPSPCGNQTDPIMSLPALGVTLHGVAPGSFPGCYLNASQAHSGLGQLANFGFDVPCVNFLDYLIEAIPGRVITAAGLWQCDPQGDLTIAAESAGGSAMFTFVARINNGSGNTFGGFVSDLRATPVARLRVLGAEGDGWNHFDDLQMVTVCAADINASGAVTVQDIFDFLEFYFASPSAPRADFNGSGLPATVQDIFDFLAAYFSGCV